MKKVLLYLGIHVLVFAWACILTLVVMAVNSYSTSAAFAIVLLSTIGTFFGILFIMDQSCNQ